MALGAYSEDIDVRLRHQSVSRALDWWLSWLILGLGLTMAMPGNSLAGPGFWRLLEIMPETSWSFLCAGVGSVRLIALFINGRAYEGSPLLRAAGAAIGCALWMQFAVAFLEMSIADGTPALGLWANLCFAGCDFHNTIRAGRDVIHARRARVQHR